MFFLHVSPSIRLSSGTIIQRHTSRFCQRCFASLTESAVYLCLVLYNLLNVDLVEVGTCRNVSDKCLFFIWSIPICVTHACASMLPCTSISLLAMCTKAWRWRTIDVETVCKYHRKTVVAQAYCYLCNKFIKNWYIWGKTYLHLLLEILGNGILNKYFVTIFTLHSWNMFLMYLDVKEEISCSIIFSFYMYSLSCVIMACWWSKLGAETSRRLLNLFIKCVGCYWRIFRSLCLIHQVGCSK